MGRFIPDANAGRGNAHGCERLGVTHHNGPKTYDRVTCSRCLVPEADQRALLQALRLRPELLTLPLARTFEVLQHFKSHLSTNEANEPSAAEHTRALVQACTHIGACEQGISSGACTRLVECAGIASHGHSCIAGIAVCKHVSVVRVALTALGNPAAAVGAVLVLLMLLLLLQGAQPAGLPKLKGQLPSPDAASCHEA